MVKNYRKNKYSKLCDGPPIKQKVVKYTKKYAACVFKNVIHIFISLSTYFNYDIIIEYSTKSYDNDPPLY